MSEKYTGTVPALLLLVLVLAVMAMGYGLRRLSPAEHVHGWSQWSAGVELQQTNWVTRMSPETRMQLRHCTNCGLEEVRYYQ